MGKAAILVSPHRFPHLEQEEELAARHDLQLVVAADQEDLVARLPDARVVLMTPFGTLGASELARAARCEAIVRYGAGYDNIDVRAAGDRNIPVANVPDASVEEVSIHAVAMALALLRRLPTGDGIIRAGNWTPAYMGGVRRLSDLTIGVLGLGRIGSRVAAHFAALGSHVVGHDPQVTDSEVELVTVDDALTSVDLVSLHLPVSASSMNLIDRATIERMRRSIVIINVSRGGLIDEHALSDALHTGQVGAAGLDVFADEPLPGGHPLRDAPNVLLSPHVAWRSDTSLGEYQDRAVAQAALVLDGRPMTTVVNAGGGS